MEIALTGPFTGINIRSGFFQRTTVKLLGPIFVDVVGPLMATTESGKKAGTNFPNEYLAVGIVWRDYGAGKVYRFLNSTTPVGETGGELMLEYR